jgi:putative hydrolase
MFELDTAERMILISPISSEAMEEGKNEEMKDLVDLHTHTIASGHAYSTIQEMVQAAKDKGVSLLGITEHAPMMPGTCHELYFLNLKVVPRRMKDVELMLGAELNIVDYNGKVDLRLGLLKQMDVCVASFHTPCYHSGSPAENTHALVGTMNNPYVGVIGHPDDGRFPLLYEEAVRAAKETGTILELNNSSLSPNGFRKDARKNDIIMLGFCEKYGVPVLLDSDAHVASAVGSHENAWKLLEELHFPSELVLNDKPQEIKRMILQKRQ